MGYAYLSRLSELSETEQQALTAERNRSTNLQKIIEGYCEEFSWVDECDEISLLAYAAAIVALLKCECQDPVVAEIMRKWPDAANNPVVGFLADCWIDDVHYR